MILWRFGPKRLSPSLVVWQVRHALLNVSCPDSVSAPLPAGSWGTAGKPSSTRNVVQTNPEIAVRAMTCSWRLNARRLTEAHSQAERPHVTTPLHPTPVRTRRPRCGGALAARHGRAKPRIAPA